MEVFAHKVILSVAKNLGRGRPFAQGDTDDFLRRTGMEIERRQICRTLEILPCALLTM